MWVNWLASIYEDTWHLDPFPKNSRESQFVRDFTCVPLILDVSLGMWPTVIPPFVTDTENVSLSTSITVCSSFAMVGFHISL